MSKQDIWLRILKERQRQDTKFGSQRKLTQQEWLTILVEEVGEVAESILEGDIPNYPVELIQVAAVCVAAIECWESNKVVRDEEAG
ncbi:hypothetical protein LCGC14_1946600 [marine sediment metagenome]|uniref:NTP pyrophosphohydrolase MazG putative catalytic core domain-containing protein n=1 Tax=marine sediment metagenome TaxID=412755 RepID=A0A0F9FJ36_9ZZZZ